MEIFEFLNVCQVHGFPKIMGVLTHLDLLKNNKTLKKTKKKLKTRFWTEVYQVIVDFCVSFVFQYDISGLSLMPRPGQSIAGLPPAGNLLVPIHTPGWTVPHPGLEPGPPNPESIALTISPLHLPVYCM